jgi:hypothetical protein
VLPGARWRRVSRRLAALALVVVAPAPAPEETAERVAAAVLAFEHLAATRCHR